MESELGLTIDYLVKLIVRFIIYVCLNTSNLINVIFYVHRYTGRFYSFIDI